MVRCDFSNRDDAAICYDASVAAQAVLGKQAAVEFFREAVVMLVDEAVRFGDVGATSQHGPPGHLPHDAGFAIDDVATRRQCADKVQALHRVGAAARDLDAARSDGESRGFLHGLPELRNRGVAFAVRLHALLGGDTRSFEVDPLRRTDSREVSVTHLVPAVMDDQKPRLKAISRPGV